MFSILIYRLPYFCLECMRLLLGLWALLAHLNAPFSMLARLTLQIITECFCDSTFYYDSLNERLSIKSLGHTMRNIITSSFAAWWKNICHFYNDLFSEGYCFYFRDHFEALHKSHNSLMHYRMMKNHHFNRNLCLWKATETLSTCAVQHAIKLFHKFLG